MQGPLISYLQNKDQCNLEPWYFPVCINPMQAFFDIAKF